jgi:hypothetical protein
MTDRAAFRRSCDPRHTTGVGAAHFPTGPPLPAAGEG